MLTLLPDLDDYVRLSDRDLELALALLDAHGRAGAGLRACAAGALSRSGAHRALPGLRCPPRPGGRVGGG